MENYSLISRGNKNMLSDKAATPVSVAGILLTVQELILMSVEYKQYNHIIFRLWFPKLDSTLFPLKIIIKWYFPTLPVYILNSVI